MTVILEMLVDRSDIDPIGHGGPPHSELSAHNRITKNENRRRHLCQKCCSVVQSPVGDVRGR